MPSIQTIHNTGLQIKGYNPYEKAVFSRGQAAPPQTVQPAQPAPAPARGAFQTFSTTDTYQQSFGSPNDYTTTITAQNVSYRLMEGNLNIRVPYAQLDLIDRTPENPLHLEGLDFNLHMKGAQLKVSDVDVSLTADYFLKSRPDLPVKDVRVSFQPNNGIKVEGKVSKFGIRLPFEVNGTFQATTTGELQYDLGKVKVVGMPVNGLMKTFGVSLDSLLKLRDPDKGYYTHGNSVTVNISKITEKPGIRAILQDARTHVGDLELTFADTPEAASQVQKTAQIKVPNYLQLSGGHFYYDGYFVKDGKVRMEDKTPDTPLQMEKTGETIMNLRKGFVAVTDPRFAGMIEGKLGPDSSLKHPQTQLKEKAAELKGDMYGFIPLKLDLQFDKTDKGDLMFTPKNPKAFGFIPLPEGFVGKQVQKMVAGGIPYGNGVAIPDLGDTYLGKLSHVSHQNGFLILKADNEP
ncbi:hypothetical protein COW36_15545 [bacterium (Candidatus Blackallbacteria) CG17_big_fil_post_rev_8_21_14_2_50_48_46]|uniref:Uncharacterized protein n=1 Tax=bacterium (Candidatus Blackallbacteria) CG17_big_fil_post_rev_8_21_14_2_50_48_46 TaxID=2014261 RepID=A0A2M7G277_9BACT|nr:MAG: hypothetical protein COW64_07690 [bacterium (Candidatus Blackallbacteria) CG18_big_fil_WC_8_21_14_2_50_49_26]PIW15882.1 MAG: hypothetical protein COW36_15545 [bacterium (Candidatus Blackallbacteria) CG17_big_fil_post_rev_8_21_14_2_50_48_46]PIW48653.1 MAG: hypothetical protein COW20_08625 [bacterium (Candidatus Blackallbacteria) CG13_big_fil_rev_8_21_14_2_50_49_14]